MRAPMCPYCYDGEIQITSTGELICCKCMEQIILKLFGERNDNKKRYEGDSQYTEPSNYR